MEPLTILVADDHPIVRDGLRMALLDLPQAEVIGEAVSGTKAVDMAASLQPDVIIMDIHMPELNGVDATRAIVAASPRVAILILTMYDDDASVFAALRAGARGYLLKGADQAEIVGAVEAVARGEAIFGPKIATRLLRYFGTVPSSQVAPALLNLTDREREVLELIAQGKSNREITRELVVSPKTVSNHVSNIFAKLHVADRAEAIVRAREAGLGRRWPRE
jgi:DNA-binding NarL/FixJ family response regulator